METAKVDIRKLQMLNDRINQAIDALNQVRLSVHGLSHTSPALGGPVGLAPGLTNPYNPLAIGYPPAGFVNPYSAGLSHTTGLSSFPTFNPGLVPGIGAPFTPGFVPGIGAPTPWPSPFVGLSHTSPEVSAWTDPFLTARIAQTFPYAQYAVPPIVSIY